MGSSGSASDVTREDVRNAVTQVGPSSTPVTATEIADRLECAPRVARDGLDDLVDDGTVRTKRIGDAERVWWQPERRSSIGLPSDRKVFGEFISAVKDYAIFTLDPDGVVASWNDGAERIKGYAADDIIGEHFSTFYTAEDCDAGAPETNLETAAKEGRVEDEGWRVRADGSRFWANVTITAIRDDDGQLRGFTKVTRDMTERREYEQELRRERDLTEKILETVPTSICMLTSDGEIVRANQRMLDRLGIDEAELAAYTIRSWTVYDEDGEPIPVDERPWARVIETGDPVHDFECQVDHPEIGRRWLSLNAAPIDDEARDDQVVVVSVDDITEQKEREQRLRRESEQTEQLLRTAPIAIAVQNADGETVMANERAQEALGLSEREIIEQSADAEKWDVYDADGEPLPPDELPSARVLATGEPVLDEELIIEPPAGDRMQFRINAAPLFGPDGDLERVVTAGKDVTELKRHERQLEQRKAELETELSEILDRISDAFYALDEEWQFTHLNDRAAEIMNRSRDEMLGREIWEMFPNATESIYWERLQTAMETQEPASFEVYEEGLDAWLEFNIYPSETGISIYFRDVTDRVAREQELQRYETIVEAVNDGVYVVDEDGRFTMVNAAYAELFGYDRGELVGEHVSTVVDDDVEEQAQELEAAMRESEVDEPVIEAELETAGGDPIVLEATFAMLPGANESEHRVGVVRDITERKRRERQLEESERRYRTLVEHFPNGAVALVDDDLRYQTVGGDPPDGVDVTPGELEGRPVEEALPSEFADELLPRYEAALDGEPGGFELERDDRVYQFQVVPVRDDAGDVFAALGMSQDITERRAYERKLEESNERLEQFAYAVSHDLQEPLRMVSSYLQLLEQRYGDELGEDGEEFIEFAVDGAERMREMIHGLLEYSRVETQGDPLEPIDLDAVLADVRDDLRVRIDESNATVTADSLPRVEGDPNQLRQLFQNLLSNAIEYSGDDPPRVDVSAERDGSDWIVSVSDEGIGIDPDDHDRIFEVFQRLHARDEHDGTGIGLALCERIVERHGGDIWVDSEPGEGTTFSFTLPAAAKADRDG